MSAEWLRNQGRFQKGGGDSSELSLEDDSGPCRWEGVGDGGGG